MARIWRAGEDSDAERLGFSSCIIVILVTSYYTTCHDLTLLILPLLLTDGIFARDTSIPGWRRTLFAASTALLLCSPLYWLLLSIDKFFSVGLLLVALIISLGMPSQRNMPQHSVR
jgi:hypothetical protein